MNGSVRRRRGQWVLLAVLFAACEPLDIQLFPVRVDAGAAQDPPDDEPGDTPVEAGTLCFPGATRCETCVAVSACSPDQRCHPLTGMCVTPCGPALPDCPAPNLCNEGLGVCVSCIDDSDCSDDDNEGEGNDEDDGEACDALQGICVECTTNDHCTDDPLERPVCLTGLNVCGCETGDDCASGICELPDAQCEEEEDEN